MHLAQDRHLGGGWLQVGAGRLVGDNSMRVGSVPTLERQ